MRSDYYLNKIIESINPQSSDIIYEIGPGDGALTQRLIQSQAQIYSIEIDDSLYQNLEDKFGKFENWKLIKEDALQIIWNDLANHQNIQAKKNQEIKLIGNLPYNISKKLIRNFLESNLQMGIFLIQKEVAEDFTARIPDATFLSNMVRVFGNCEYLFQVPKEYFYPEPKVDGGLIKIIKSPSGSDRYVTLTEKQRFIKFIHAMFASPRKTLANNLKNYLNSIDRNFDKAQVENILTQANIKLNARPQEVEFEKMREIYNLFI